MDPRIAWFPPEQLGPSHALWTRLWEKQAVELEFDSNAQLEDAMNVMNLNNNPNLENKPSEFIPLDFNNRFDVKQGLTNKQNFIHNQQFQSRKKDNRASTYGLNHSSKSHFLRENGGLTPWTSGENHYTPGVIGYVFAENHFSVILGTRSLYPK